MRVTEAAGDTGVLLCSVVDVNIGTAHGSVDEVRGEEPTRIAPG